MDALTRFDERDAHTEREERAYRRYLRRFGTRRVIVANHVKMYVYRTVVEVQGGR